MSINQPRKPAGRPDGGQFSATSRTGSGLDLADDQDKKHLGLRRDIRAYVFNEVSCVTDELRDVEPELKAVSVTSDHSGFPCLDQAYGPSGQLDLDDKKRSELDRVLWQCRIPPAYLEQLQVEHPHRVVHPKIDLDDARMVHHKAQAKAACEPRDVSRHLRAEIHNRLKADLRDSIDVVIDRLPKGARVREVFVYNDEGSEVHGCAMAWVDEYGRTHDVPFDGQGPVCPVNMSEDAEHYYCPPADDVASAGFEPIVDSRESCIGYVVTRGQMDAARVPAGQMTFDLNKIA